MNTVLEVGVWDSRMWGPRQPIIGEGTNSQTYSSFGIAENYVYIAFSELYYLTKGQFATLRL